MVAYFAWRTKVSGPTWRRMAIWFCRSAGLVLLILALAGLQSRTLSDLRHVIFVTDVSRSVGGGASSAAQRFVEEAQQHRGRHQVAFLPFAGHPGKLQTAWGGETEPLDELASDPAAAVRLALAALPSDHVPQVVLLTDGNETQGQLARAAIGAGLPIWVKPLPSFPQPAACVAEVLAPAQASLSGDVPIEVVVTANYEGPAKLELLGSATPLEPQAVKLVAGENRFHWIGNLGGQPSAVFEARLTGTQDATLPSDTKAGVDRHQRRAMVFAPPRLRLLLVARAVQQAEPFQQMLRSQGFEVSLQAPDRLPDAVSGLASYDVLVLSDVPSKQFNTKQLLAVRDFVRDRRGGLLVLGGEDTFGQAAYQDTPLERMLPVKAAEMIEAQKKSVLAMVLVIDRSGSMLDQDRMKLAKEAAKTSVQVLDPQDKIGVMAFSDHATWVAPISLGSNKEELRRQIDKLEPAGQTQMYEAVERAFLALEQTDADRRHMVLLTDGIPTPGDFSRLAQRMAKAGITVSTVSIGKDADPDILKDMARIARGLYHPCENPAEISKILVQETRTAAGEVKAQEFVPFAFRALPGLDVSSAPPLQGYAATNPKPNSELLLLAAGGDPLLSWWRYGGGVSLAFTADMQGKWAKKWASWNGLGPFWKRLVRHAAPVPPPDRAVLSLQRIGQEAFATLDVRDEAGEYLNGVKVQMTVTKPDNSQETLDAAQVAPGRYQARFAASQCVVQAIVPGKTDAGVTVQRALFVDYPDELQIRPTNEPLLRSVAAVSGGVYDPEPAAVFAPDGRTVERVTPLWSLLVLGALLFFVVDVALRRLRFWDAPGKAKLSLRPLV